MTECAEISTKERILDAAENVFADDGFDGASLRCIVQSAGVNLATVYYYFGSKEGLMTAVFKRIFDPINEQQISGLKRLKEMSVQQAPSVESILEALLVPAGTFSENRSLRTEIAARLIGRILTDPAPRTQELLLCMHDEKRALYTELLNKALPDLSNETLHWRMEFLWGAIAFVLCNPRRFEQQTQGLCGSIQANLLPQMIACFSAGLRAPVVPIK